VIWCAGGAYSSRQPWGQRWLSSWFSRSLLALLLLSVPSLTATAQASPPTTPTDAFVSQTLRPLLEAALSSSEDSDSNSLTLQQRIDADATQKKLDDAERKKEQEASATAYSGLLLRAGTLQTYFDALSSKLTDFSGSDAEKQKAALAAVDSIKAGVQAVELENKILKVAAIGSGVALVVAVIVAIVK
jgi:hypothetical protein